MGLVVIAKIKHVPSKITRFDVSSAVVGAILRDRPAFALNLLNPGGHGGPPLQHPFSGVTTGLA
jgi:hypothetical protein